MNLLRYIPMLAFLLIFASCEDDNNGPTTGDLEDIPYNPVSYELDIPANFPEPTIPQDNQLTVDGVLLGRHLFYDPILSADSSMSCASCHAPVANFTDNLAVSPGIDGISGTRSSMSLINVAYQTNGLFWDGRVQTLEEQAELPVEDPVELHHQWPNVIADLKAHDTYPMMFRKAFGINDRSEMTKELAAKALAQFERIMISGNSKYDKQVRGETFFTDEELNGFDIFFDNEPDLPDAECGHCHNIPLFTTNQYLNNGLDAVFDDPGYSAVTGNPLDIGAFKIPTLRNIMHSGPYMHDGRFETIDEVLEHYISGGVFSETAHPLIRPLDTLLNNPQHVADLKAFLNSLTDTTFLNNPDLQNPFE